MKINNILSVFSPKDTRFFPLMKETANILVESSTLLQELFLADNSRWNDLCRRIKEEEVKGDKVTGRILKALNETFITPFDREDINALADVMDDVIDAMNRAAQKVLLYYPETLPECTIKLTNIIKDACLEVQGGVNELEHIKKVDQQFRLHYKTIKALEEEADTIYEKGIIDLFKHEKNTVELIKLEKIIQELEKTVNKLNNTGKAMKTIFVKYA